MPRELFDPWLSTFSLEPIPYNLIVKKKPKFDSKKKKIMLNRLKRTGTISIEQYKKLFWEDPYLYSWINFFYVNEIRTNNKYSFMDKQKLLKEKFMKLPGRISDKKLYHNYVNINNIISYKEKNNIETELIHFDSELKLENNKYYYKKYISPDGAIFTDKIIYLFETDLWTESYRTLEEKANSYFNYINKNYKNHQFKLILFTTIIRIFTLNKNPTFINLKNYDLIEYYPNIS